MSSAIILCVAALAAIVVVRSLASAPQMNLISGRIFVEGRGGCPAAIVWIDPIHKTIADSLGNYVLTGVDEGTHVIRAWSELCLARIVDTVRVSGTDVTGVNDTLFAGDLVGDGRINLFDAGEIIGRQGATPDSSVWDRAIDLNGDGRIDSLDVATLMKHWNEKGDSSALLVAEPSVTTFWAPGQPNVSIRWVPGRPGGTVSISLFKAGVKVCDISTSTPNDGSYSDWNAPNDLIPGVEYKVRVYAGTGREAYSDGFRIGAFVTITVTEPSATTAWRPCQANPPITWETADLGGSVSIGLYRGSALAWTISSSTPNDGSYADYSVPKNLIPGAGYRVLVYWRGTPFDYYDYSDGFTVQPVRPLVTEPNGGTPWTVGLTSGSILWENVCDVGGNVSIELYRGNGVADVITPSTPNTGGYTGYVVPSGLVPAANYWVRVSYESGFCDSSEYFQIRGRPLRSGWFWQNPLPQGNHLNGVSFVDSNTGTAVGDYGTILRTTDGGATWARQESYTTVNLNSVRLLDSSKGLAVGASGTILQTTDGGETWIARVSGVSSELAGVTFADPKTWVAVGLKDTPIRSTDGGSTWAGCTCIGDGNGLDAFRSVSFADSEVGLAMGAFATTWRTTDRGATWRLVTWSMDDYVFCVACLDTSTAVAGGYWYGIGVDGEYRNFATIYRTSDCGHTWRSQRTSSSTSFRGVSFPRATTGTMVGDYGIIRRTTDAVNWATQTSNTMNNLLGVSFSDEDFGTTVGAAGTILRTTNGGTSWLSQTRSASSALLRGVVFTDANTGLAYGDDGAGLFTTDGGSTWLARSICTGHTTTDVSFVNGRIGTAAAWYYTIGNDFPLGEIFRTVDGGATWTRQLAVWWIQFNGVSFVNADTGTVVGDSGKIMRTTNGGATWVEQTSGVGVGTRLEKVRLITANRGVAVGGIYGEGPGVILVTTDGGATWTQPWSGTANYLMDLSFIDAGTGWVVGKGGAILKTTDGGATWVPQVSGTTNDLYRVYFTDANRGTVVGLSGTILRTTDGGATWVRQVSGTFNALRGVYFTDANTGTLVGDYGTILRTVTGGQ